MPKSKHTPEKTAKYLVDKFYSLHFHSLELEYQQKEIAIRSAIILAEEAIFISSKDYNAEWSNRTLYWKEVLRILKNKLK